MSETWRRKTYYPPRVLIDSTKVLVPTFDDALLCITGAQLEMLRNLTQYLHRRSTFVAEYHEGFYLVENNTNWDEIQGIVAELEETLMGCEEFTALFEAMLAQLQCICNKTSIPPPDLGSVAPIVDGYLDDGQMIEDDPYADDTEVDADRCAVAQLTFWQAWGWLTEWIQPTQENLIDALLPIAMGILVTTVGLTPLAIPAGALLVLLQTLIEVWAAGSLIDVQNAVWANSDEFTCAVYAGLLFDYGMAETRAAEVIEDMTELSPIDRVVMRLMFSPWAIALASKAYINATDWALANVSPGACDDCTWVYERVYEFPPCPGIFTGGFPCYKSRYPGLNGNEFGYSPSFTIPAITSNIDIEIECRWTSKFGPGWTVGYAQVEYQDAALDWHLIGQCQVSTTVAAGAINVDEVITPNQALDRNVLRVNIHGQPGQGDSDPWPFMPKYIRIKITPHI